MDAMPMSDHFCIRLLNNIWKLNLRAYANPPLLSDFLSCSFKRTWKTTELSDFHTQRAFFPLVFSPPTVPPQHQTNKGIQWRPFELDEEPTEISTTGHGHRHILVDENASNSPWGAARKLEETPHHTYPHPRHPRINVQGGLSSVAPYRSLPGSAQTSSS